MGVDLRMEPYATEFEKEKPESKILDEFCFPDIDKLFVHLGMRWDDYSALRLLAAVESHQLPPELNRGNARSALIDKRDKLLILLRCYRHWYEHLDRVPTQLQQFIRSAPQLAGIVANRSESERCPKLMLA